MLPKDENLNESGSSDSILNELGEYALNTDIKHYPQVEDLHNMIFWPEGPRGGVDFAHIYEMPYSINNGDIPSEFLEMIKRR